MQTIFELKEQALTDTPLLLFECTLADGRVERWCTHKVSVNGADYSARVMQHNVFELQAASEMGIDSVPRITVSLANADSHFSEIERSIGMKGAKLTVSFLFYDLKNAAALTDASVVFQGVCNPPDEIREATFRITATNRMNLQRLLMPQVRIQRRCPWEFPTNDAQRAEAVNGGANSKYSRYYRCGYSTGVAGGTGSLNGDAAFTTCGYTRGDCQARGMFPNFGGIEFVPPAIQVRTYGDKSWHTSALQANEARYNDFVPMVYGTAWYNPPVVFARNDGNLTRMEVLLGLGEMQGVLKVLVNDIEIPAGVAGTNMTGTGWYNIPTLGSRSGAFNMDFTDSSGHPAGDPYGSMAYLSVVVPNRINDGQSLPKVSVLAQGMKVPVYAGDGSFVSEQFSNNPAWIVLDLLRRSGWSTSEIDLRSFAAAAVYCDESIAALDVYGNPTTLARFQCNLAIQKRRSAGDLLRGIRNSARMMVTYGVGGMLQARIESTVSGEHSAKPAGSNSTQPLSGGWPAYEFGDGSNGYSGILRRNNGEPSLRMFSRGMADTPNRFSVEFQDSLNEYQQDSFSLVDADDVSLSGQELSQTLPALGLANFDQAARILKVNLDKSIRGNTYVEFETSVKAFGVRPGDLITLTYLKEGFTRQPFRVLKIAPDVNHRVSTITAQIHDDSWYADSNGQVTSASGGRRLGSAGFGVPRPLLGSVLDDHGDVQFEVQESATMAGDGTAQTNVTVGFVAPTVAAAGGPGIPMISLAATIGSGGSIDAGQTLYYAVAAVDASGAESALSFVVRAAIAGDASSVILTGLSFSPTTSGFNVYRGSTPALMYRVASNQPVAAQFVDTGLPKQLIVPSDPSFDHANFYWRLELQGENVATIHTGTTIGNDALRMTANRYRNSVARITRGRGTGQERVISANTDKVLTVAPAWDVVPDASSYWAVAETGWQFGALSKTSPVQFEIPNRGGETVEICGRSANVSDIECAAELSTVTRWQIGGSGTSDTDVPPMPFFGLGLGKQGGTIEVSGVSFTDLTNTRTISAATLTLHYWDEVGGRSSVALANAIGASDTLLDLTAAGSDAVGNLVQIEGEVVRVEEVQSNGTRYRVTRGAQGSAAAAHGASAALYPLLSKTSIAPFPPDFFGSPYSGSWSYPIPLPDARVASAELFVTNARGNSVTKTVCMTNTMDGGLRTLSGGQYSIQVNGFLAVQQSATPAISVESSHAVRDVFAMLGTVADAPVALQVNVDGAAWCTVTIATGMTTSPSVSGLSLGPLQMGSKLTMSVLSVGQTYPGADLTLVVRL